VTSQQRLEALAEALNLESCHFAELLGTLHALRFTGPITLHLLNGSPQAAELGAPLRATFSEHPANRKLDSPSELSHPSG
jgi:hypothetical protein